MRFKASDEDGYSVVVSAEELDDAVQIDRLAKTLQSLVGERHDLVVCPHCSTSLDEALQSGLFGCGLCYSVLYDAYIEESHRRAASSS